MQYELIVCHTSVSLNPLADLRDIGQGSMSTIGNVRNMSENIWTKTSCQSSLGELSEYCQHFLYYIGLSICIYTALCITVVIIGGT